ncbi:MAG TPA: hypothetical protein VLJ61_16030 [Pyrinomonadaceae bacterium]|nr:hypothetical protein [Pyrinomonadaceae bacterium]
MKKTHLSSVTALLLSLSLVIGILVSDFAGARFLTTAHAESGQCTGQGAGTTIITPSVEIGDGETAVQGIIISDVTVGSEVVSQGVISGNVKVSNSTFVGADGVTANGVLVGDDFIADGVLVGDVAPCTTGVLVGDVLTMDGVLVGDDFTATGGVLVGDDISVNGGVITGQNLRLIGSTIAGKSASVGGIIKAVEGGRVAPSN